MTANTSPLSRETFNAAQAALLDSECSPREAVQAVLRAAAQFAESEDVGDFEDLARAAWADRQDERNGVE